MLHINNVMIQCLLEYGCEVYELINLARDGDEVAFVELVRLDSIFLTADFATKFFGIIELSKNDKCRQDVAKAIKSKRKSIHAEDKKRAWAFRLLARLGYLEKTDSDWAEFLYGHGFPECIDPGLVKTLRYRYGISKKK